jgi:hypothetical protein
MSAPHRPQSLSQTFVQSLSQTNNDNNNDNNNNNNTLPQIKTKTASFSNTQRKHHRIHITRQERIYLVLLFLAGLGIIISVTVFLPNIPTDLELSINNTPVSIHCGKKYSAESKTFRIPELCEYRSVPLWFVAPLYSIVALFVLITIVRFMPISWCNRASNLDRSICSKLIFDPFVAFVLVVGVLFLLLETLDPTSNVTAANAIVTLIQLTSITFADALVFTHKSFDLISM